MKKKYSKPKMVVLDLERERIVRCSNPTDIDGGNWTPWY